MCAPESFQSVTMHLFGSSPPFRSPQHNHWPAYPFRHSTLASSLLLLSDFGDTVFSGRRHCLMHALWIRAFHKVRCPAVAPKEVFQFLVTDTCEQCRVINL